MMVGSGKNSDIEKTYMRSFCLSFRNRNHLMQMNWILCLGMIICFELQVGGGEAQPPWPLLLPCAGCQANSTQIRQIAEERNHCGKPCQCPLEFPQCQDGVPVVIDGCGCCPVCARQQGDVCNQVQVCDVTRKLQCSYANPFSTSGICRVRRGQGCRVGNSIYRDGETFKLDCRTQCTCQNGTYGCVSLCPHESVRPSSRCRHPQLVRIHGSCCREWLCESTVWEDRESHCKRFTSEWTSCSATCGIGASTRVSNDNPECHIKNETRLCILRPCEALTLGLPTGGHHVRKNHVCRATLRSSDPLQLKDGANCTSVEFHQLKYCGYCPTHACCRPQVTTTKNVQFHCVEDGESTVVQKEVLWIIKCSCTNTC